MISENHLKMALTKINLQLNVLFLNVLKKYLYYFLCLETIILKVKVFHNWGKRLCSILLLI